MVESTTIRINTEIKEELDKIRLPSESYSSLIHRLLKEIKELENINESLVHDKEQLYKIALKTSDSIAFPNNVHRITYFISLVVNDISLTEQEKLQQLKLYLNEMLEANPDDVKETIELLKDMFISDGGSVPEVLIEFEKYVNDVTS